MYPIMFPSAPCPPEDVTNAVTCDSRSANISWSAVPGAVSYTATLEQMNGDATCCTTSDTGCDIADLPCGEMFVLLVTAEGRTCNSSQSAGDILRTGEQTQLTTDLPELAVNSRVCVSTVLPQFRAFPRTSRAT